MRDTSPIDFEPHCGWDSQNIVRLTCEAAYRMSELPRRPAARSHGPLPGSAYPLLGVSSAPDGQCGPLPGFESHLVSQISGGAKPVAVHHSGATNLALRDGGVVLGSQHQHRSVSNRTLFHRDGGTVGLWTPIHHISVGPSRSGGAMGCPDCPVRLGCPPGPIATGTSTWSSADRRPP